MIKTDHTAYIINALLADELLLQLAYVAFVMKRDPLGDITARRLTRQERIFYMAELEKLEKMGIDEREIQDAMSKTAHQRLRNVER